MCKCKTSVGSREAPQNLQAIRIRDSVGTTRAYRIIQAVLQLPSVRTVEFIGLRLNYREMSSVNSDFKPNNLSSLTFTDCRISSNIMDLILGNMDRLQNFSFVTHHTMADYLPIHPYFIQAGLGIASRDTLRTLQTWVAILPSQWAIECINTLVACEVFVYWSM